MVLAQILKLVTILLPFLNGLRGEVFTSQADLEGLIFLRREVNQAIDLFLREEIQRLDYLQKRLSSSRGLSTHDKNSEFGDATGSGSGNPIEAFLLVKGLSLDLAELVAISGDRENYKKFTSKIEELHRITPFPGSEDISGAAMGLIRLQDTYQLDTRSVASGALGDSCCATQLSVEDCFELGRQSYNAKNYDFAIEWMSEALARFPAWEAVTTSNSHENQTETDSTKDLQPILQNQTTLRISKGEIQNYLDWAHDIKKTLEIGKEFLSTLTGIELDAFVEQVAQVVTGQTTSTNSEGTGNANDNPSQKETGAIYKSLCRGDANNLTAQNPKLTCSYSTRGSHWGYLIGPLKQEVVHLDPDIVIFRDFLQSSEIEVIKSLARPKFETAMIVNVMTGSNVRSDTRISKSAWLTDDEHPIVSKVNRRLGHLTGLEMSTAELLQVANYGIGGMYLPHYDFALPGQAANFLESQGNRVATVLMYMSKVEKGGATVFPRLNLSLWPQLGSVVFWYNLKRNGAGDMRTQHAACPVLVGSKWVSNKWIHERGQELRYTCGLDKND